MLHANQLDHIACDDLQGLTVLLRDPRVVHAEHPSSAVYVQRGRDVVRIPLNRRARRLGTPARAQLVRSSRETQGRRLGQVLLPRRPILLERGRRAAAPLLTTDKEGPGLSLLSRNEALPVQRWLVLHPRGPSVAAPQRCRCRLSEVLAV